MKPFLDIRFSVLHCSKTTCGFMSSLYIFCLDFDPMGVYGIIALYCALLLTLIVDSWCRLYRLVYGLDDS